MEFIVKNESIKTFLKSAFEATDRTLEDFERGRLHNYFKNNLIVKQSVIPEGIETVKIIMEDRSEGGSILINFYTYSVDNYDSISKSLTLINFEVLCKGHQTLKLKGE